LIFQTSWQEQDSDTEDEETTDIHDNKDQEDNWTVSGDSVYLPPFDPALFPSFPYPPPPPILRSVYPPTSYFRAIAPRLANATRSNKIYYIFTLKKIGNCYTPSQAPYVQRCIRSKHVAYVAHTHTHTHTHTHSFTHTHTHTHTHTQHACYFPRCLHPKTCHKTCQLEFRAKANPRDEPLHKGVQRPCVQ
jgi:ABC-type nickel/cobalt efflux system permease component RcnA